MKQKLKLLCIVLPSVVALAASPEPAPKEHVFDTQPLGMKLSIKMVGPYMEAADLQIICLFKHKESGDTYQGAAKDTDEHLRSLLSNLRNRGEFTGELGETILFDPPKGTIPAKRFMVVGLGDEQSLSLDSLRVVGRIAAREAVRLRASHVAWAPVIRDQGNSTIDVASGDRAFIEQMLLAYGTEKRLQTQKLSPTFSIDSFVIEAGPSYFDSVVKEVGEGISTATAEMNHRSSDPYLSGKPNE